VFSLVLVHLHGVERDEGPRRIGRAMLRDPRLEGSRPADLHHFERGPEHRETDRPDTWQHETLGREPRE
jgi:hypothetical protein